jgi:hypothetical protein
VTVPRSRHSDLVLLQNGALHPILDAAGVSLPLGGAAERGSRGCKPEVTQLLLYAAGERGLLVWLWCSGWVVQKAVN